MEHHTGQITDLERAWEYGKRAIDVYGNAEQIGTGCFGLLDGGWGILTVDTLWKL